MAAKKKVDPTPMFNTAFELAKELGMDNLYSDTTAARIKTRELQLKHPGMELLHGLYEAAEHSQLTYARLGERRPPVNGRPNLSALYDGSPRIEQVIAETDHARVTFEYDGSLSAEFQPKHPVTGSFMDERRHEMKIDSPTDRSYATMCAYAVRALRGE